MYFYSCHNSCENKLLLSLPYDTSAHVTLSPHTYPHSYPSVFLSVSLCLSHFFSATLHQKTVSDPLPYSCCLTSSSHHSLLYSILFESLTTRSFTLSKDSLNSHPFLLHSRLTLTDHVNLINNYYFCHIIFLLIILTKSFCQKPSPLTFVNLFIKLTTLSIICLTCFIKIPHII